MLLERFETNQETSREPCVNLMLAKGSDGEQWKATFTDLFAQILSTYSNRIVDNSGATA